MPAPNIKEIEWAIHDLQNKESSNNRYVLLAALYACRDHMLEDTQPKPRIAAHESNPAKVNDVLAQYGSSDFLQAIAGKSPDNVWSVIDELMDTLLLIRPKVYESVMSKLERL